MTSHRVNLKLFINKPNYLDKDSRLYISFLIHHAMNHCKTGIDTMNLLFCIIYNPLSLEQEDLNVYLYCAPCVGGMVCVHSGAQNNSNCGIHCGNRHAWVL